MNTNRKFAARATLTTMITIGVGVYLCIYLTATEVQDKAAAKTVVLTLSHVRHDQIGELDDLWFEMEAPTESTTARSSSRVRPSTAEIRYRSRSRTAGSITRATVFTVEAPQSIDMDTPNGPITLPEAIGRRRFVTATRTEFGNPVEVTSLPGFRCNRRLQRLDALGALCVVRHVGSASSVIRSTRGNHSWAHSAPRRSRAAPTGFSR
jgi:hypothetical protein